MRVLVAGWHGQVAQALAERGAARDDVSQLAVGRPALDLMDSPSIGRTLFGMSPEVIINSAAYTDVEAAETEPSRAFRLKRARLWYSGAPRCAAWRADHSSFHQPCV